MSLIGGFRASGIGSVSGNIASDRIINFTGFKPVSLDGGNVLGVALYVFSGSSDAGGYWTPATVKMLGGLI